MEKTPNRNPYLENLKKEQGLDKWDLKDINILWQVVYKAWSKQGKKFKIEDIRPEVLKMYKEIKLTQENIADGLHKESTIAKKLREEDKNLKEEAKALNF